MISLPSSPTDKYKLADWLELTAATARDRSSSAGDLERILRQAGLAELQDDNTVESLLGEVLFELRHRATAAGSGYPYEVDGSALRCRSRRNRFSIYVFCLCLSWFGDSNVAGLYPRRLFEHLSAFAAQRYLSGDSVRFGFPRIGLPRGFDKAIEDLTTRRLIEGGGYKAGAAQAGKDQHLDVVAWRHFPDSGPNKLVLFGQCASGKNWKAKVNELDQDAFTEAFFINSLSKNTTVKAFFMPHQINLSNTYDARVAGIMFDRCRISAMIHRPRGMGDSDIIDKCVKFVQTCLTSPPAESVA